MSPKGGTDQLREYICQHLRYCIGGAATAENSGPSTQNTENTQRTLRTATGAEREGRTKPRQCSNPPLPLW